MFIYIARLIVIISGPVIGYTRVSSDSKGILIGTAVALLVIGAEILIQKVRLDDLIAGGIGLIAGLVAAYLINNIVPGLMNNQVISQLFDAYNPLVSIVLGYIGMIFALNKKGELDLLDKDIQLAGNRFPKSLKVVDTSAIIDARLLDVVDVGFVEGILVIPSAVMDEVQATADSPNEEKRNKGRRALDIVNSLRESENINVRIYEKDYPEIEKTDAKLVKLCQELKAKLITTDFNLTKAAQAQGVSVLNVNELANVMKPKLLPGEAINIFVLKKGKDKEQGIGYLDDGTMVIIDDGKNYIGKKIEVTVSTVLQKASGRMIFAKKS
jgi:uncharacterized protein YacL